LAAGGKTGKKAVAEAAEAAHTAQAAIVSKINEYFYKNMRFVYGIIWYN